jgi:hypothetical protein
MCHFHSPFTIRHSPFAIRHSPFTIPPVASHSRCRGQMQWQMANGNGKWQWQMANGSMAK